MNLLERLRLRRAMQRCRLEVQRQFLDTPLPGRGDPLPGLEMIALDFETTGLDPQRDHIVAAGWVMIRGERIVMASAREFRVRSGGSDGVGQSAVIHGILDSDLEEAESLEAMLAALLPDLAGRVIVAHAAPIERGFLNVALRRLGGVPVRNPFVDTLRLERVLVEGEGGGVDDHRGDLALDACRARRGLPEHGQHSAAADAVACAELLLAQVAHLGGAERLRLRHLR